MKKLALLLCLLPWAAWGQSSPGWPLGFVPTMQQWNAAFAAKQDVPGRGTYLYAISYGVRADGVTSDDAALKAAADACSALGTTLFLPPGRILLNGTGGTSVTVKNCAIIGVQVPAGTAGDNASMGTTILLTSTTVAPFKAASNWSMQGINFYWPNQTTGTTVYPALISDLESGSSACVCDWFMDHVNIINAYDGIKQTTAGSGRFFITNGTHYAVHDMYQWGSIGDTGRISGVQYSPGPWIRICGSACFTAVNAGALVNSIFHATSLSGPFAGGPLSVVVENTSSFGWRYGFKVDSGASVTLGGANLKWQGVGSIVDASSGGAFSLTTPVTHSGDCGSVPAYPSAAGVTANVCYNMGANSTLVLSNSVLAVYGGLVSMSGGEVFLDNVQALGIGSSPVAGTTDFYAVNVTGASGVVSVKNSRFSGQPASTHTHGINIGTLTSRVDVQANSFENLQDPVTMIAAPTTMLLGNRSIGTNGSVSVAISNSATNPVAAYGGNSWDKPPVATFTTAGTGNSVAASDGFSGVIVVGTTVATAPVGTLTLPFQTAVNSCQFTPTAGVILSATSASPPAWAVYSNSSIASGTISFRCAGGM